MDIQEFRRIAFSPNTRIMRREVTTHQLMHNDRLMAAFSQGQGSVSNLTHDDGLDNFVFGVSPMDDTVRVGFGES